MYSVWNGSHAEIDQWAFSGVLRGCGQNLRVEEIRNIFRQSGFEIWTEKSLEFWGRSYTCLGVYNSHNWTYAGYVTEEVPRSVDAIL